MPALLLSVFIDTVGFGIVLPLLPFFAERFGAAPLTVTLLASVYSLAQFVFAPIWGRLSDRWGRRPVLLLTIGGTAGNIHLLAFPNSQITGVSYSDRDGIVVANLTIMARANTDAGEDAFSYVHM